MVTLLRCNKCEEESLASCFVIEKYENNNFCKQIFYVLKQFSGPFQKEIQHPLQPAELASSPFGPREW